MTSPLPGPTAFRREVAGRFGLVPNFFMSAPDAPELIERLWGFAKSAYLDNPIPSLFKERLFVYLSRFCEVRYCIARHCAFLVGYGHSSGDPDAPPQTIEQAIQLLKAPTPWQRDMEAVLGALHAAPPAADWPAPGSDLEDRLFSAATLVFVEGGRSARARRALRHVLGGRRSEHLLGLLAFIRTAHYWTLLHSDLLFEEDVSVLFTTNRELARLLLEDPEAGRCEMGLRLFSELEDLRGLHERHELEQAKGALEVLVEQKEVLLKEVNHRVKNSLQIVSSILELQVGGLQGAPADALRSAASRVMAIAAVHERLYTGNDLRVVALGAFLGDLCQEIGRAHGCATGIETSIAPVDVPTDMAIPLAIIVNELITNVIKHAGPPCRIELRAEPARLTLTVSDTGAGPSKDKHATGMGSRLVQALVGQLGARLGTSQLAGGYSVEIIVPLTRSK